MKVAFYKGKRKGWYGFVDSVIRFVINGKYSHVELVFSDGMSASSSYRDGGVRFKRIEFDPNHWDFLPVGGDEQLARKWFEMHQGRSYDLLGAAGFIFRPSDSYSQKFFCSEAVMESIGFEESWRFDPSVCFSILNRLYGPIES